LPFALIGRGEDGLEAAVKTTKGSFNKRTKDFIITNMTFNITNSLEENV
jgi:hypothetical protein